MFDDCAVILGKRKPGMLNSICFDCWLSPLHAIYGTIKKYIAGYDF